jgi:multiple sugar transport system substrate-binding protein
MKTARSRIPAMAIAAILAAACGAASPTATPAPTATQPAAATPTATAGASATPAGTPAETASGSPGASASPSATPVPTPVIVGPGNVGAGVKLVRWYCCLGTGDAPEQVAVETKVINAFNASHTDIQIQGEFVIYAQAFDQLSTEIAGGNPPDLIGPLGFGGANAYAGHWLDLQPLIDSTGFDTTQFESSSVDYFKVGDHQEGLPFAIYPSELYYQRGAFAEIGINEPPHKYGEDYVATGAAAQALNVADGTSVPWDKDTARTLALLLTVDSNNKDATQTGFDPTNIAQYGYEPQRDDMRGLGAYWGAGRLVAADGHTAQIPAPWAAAWHWYYDGIWKDHFIADGSHYNDQISWNPDGVPFCNGKVAMADNFIWSTYCLAGAGDNWDIAAVPGYNGTQTAAFNADTFRIWKDTKNADAAFTVLTYLLTEGAADLTTTYGGMPAREELRQDFFDSLESSIVDELGSKLQQPIDWQVVNDGINHADVPNFESPLPINKSGENTYNESVAAITTYATRWDTQGGLDMDTEIANLTRDLQAIWDK